MLETMTRRMRARSAALLTSIEAGLGRIMIFWLLLAGLAVTLRIAQSPIPNGVQPATLAPYALLIFAPLASMALALRWFADGEHQAQPAFRLARIGDWHIVTREQAMRHRLYGTSGLMVSLLIAILLNVPIRGLEYLAAMPALAGAVPAWLSRLQLIMTIDVVLLSSLYTIAFVAALRRVPSFPRLIAAVWMLDLAMQVTTSQVMARVAELPRGVAGPLHSLLEGNVLKVLASIAVWLPYLLLSKRVNVTFRHRIPA